MLKKAFLIIFLLLLFPLVQTSNDPIKNNYIIKEGAVPKELPIAQIIIDKISVNNYIYNYDSKNNTVEKNVELLRGSTFPDYDNSILFLAAHSGNSKISYFNNIDRLKNGDIITIYHGNYKYLYAVKKSYLIEKDGDIEVNKSFKNELILTTCSRQFSDKQLIVSSSLTNKIKI